MKITKQLIEVFKNISTYNDKFYYEPLSNIKLKSVLGSDFIEANMKLEGIDEIFAISDMQNFISSMSIIGEDGTISIKDNQVTLNNGSETIKYNARNNTLVKDLSYTDKNFDTIQLDEVEFDFVLTSQQFKKIIQSSSLLDCNNFVIEKNKDNIIMKLTSRISSSHTYKIKLAEYIKATDNTSYEIPVDRLNLIRANIYHFQIGYIINKSNSTRVPIIKVKADDIMKYVYVIKG